MPAGVRSKTGLGVSGGQGKKMDEQILYGDACPGERGNSRPPKFGDPMRGVWASASNPQRDGLYVRTIRRNGRQTNPGTWYQMTDSNGRFWEYQAKDTVFLTPNV